MSLYLDPVNYWKDGYKRFDATVLFLAYLPYTIDHSNPKMHHTVTMLKGFQALRVLKLLYYSPGITVSNQIQLPFYCSQGTSHLSCTLV